MRKMTPNLKAPALRKIARPSCGSREMTLEKMSTDIPFPMPRCVMSSPIHMIVAVPAVMTRTMSAMFGAVKEPDGKMSTPPSWSDREWKRNTRPVDCRSARRTVT